MAVKKPETKTSTVAATPNATETVGATTTTTTNASPNTAEAKSRFNAALDEAKAGAATTPTPFFRSCAPAVTVKKPRFAVASGQPTPGPRLAISPSKASIRLARPLPACRG